MKALYKRWFKARWFKEAVCLFAAGYIWLVYHTSRKQIDMDAAAEPYMRGEKPALFAFWHGRMLLMPMICPRGRKTHVMISVHRDGAMIARTMEHFGLGIISGSTSRGGSTAAMQAVRRLEEGENVAITPDGPRGPAMKAQEGVASVSAMAQVPVIPAAFSSTRYKRMRSWDRFLLALPFGRIYYAVGAPLAKASAGTVEQAMVTLTQAVDAKAGIA